MIITPEIIAHHCRVAESMTLPALAAVAVGRGAANYSHLCVDAGPPNATAGIMHEVLGSALMRAALPQEYDYLRCGMMVISDLANNSDVIVHAARFFGIQHRIRLLAILGNAFDACDPIMAVLVSRLPLLAKTDEGLPCSIIQFTSLERQADAPQSRVWLRTNFTSR